MNMLTSKIRYVLCKFIKITQPCTKYQMEMSHKTAGKRLDMYY